MACKARETCARCLWLWPVLENPCGQKRMCYCDKSAHYRHERFRADVACTTFEYGISGSGYPTGRERKRK